MSKLFDKFLSKVLAVIVIVLFVVVFREMILTDNDVSAAFGALMGTLPFAKVITDVVCKILKYQYTVPIISTTSVLTDLIRLAFMACLQPIAVGLLTAIFLPVPATRDYREREEYMDGFGYRAKELAITVFSAPLLAVASSMLSAAMMDFLSKNFSQWISNLVGCLITILLGGASVTILSVAARIAVSTAIGWRILVTFGGGMIKSFVTNALCLTIYVAVLRGARGQIATYVVLLIIALFMMDLGLKYLQRAVVGDPQKW